jgi:hypothetical protein
VNYNVIHTDVHVHSECVMDYHRVATVLRSLRALSKSSDRKTIQADVFFRMRAPYRYIPVGHGRGSSMNPDPGTEEGKVLDTSLSQSLSVVSDVPST